MGDSDSKGAAFKKFCYNSDDGSVCGRTASSWAKIGLFYLVFYSCLAGFFAVMLMIFFQCMDDVKPNMVGMNSLIKNNPGMAHRPMPKVSSSLISFSQGDKDSFKKYVDNIEVLLTKYSNEHEAKWKEEELPDDKIHLAGQLKYEYQDCTGKSIEDIAADTYTDERYGRTFQKPCKFDAAKAFAGSKCTAENSFGYYDGTPCMLFKLNKIFDWSPEPYDYSQDDAELQGQTSKGGHKNLESKEELYEYKTYSYSYKNNGTDGIPVTCIGENAGDVDNLGEVKFYPSSGFYTNFFPFNGQPGYQAPLVMVQMDKVNKGVLIQAMCKAWAKNIYHHKNDKAGSTRFELLID